MQPANGLCNRQEYVKRQQKKIVWVTANLRNSPDGLQWNKTFNLQDLKVLEDENQMLKAEIESMKHELSIAQSGKEHPKVLGENKILYLFLVSNQKVIKQCMSLWDAPKDPGARKEIKGVLEPEVHRVEEVSKERRDLKDQGEIEVTNNNDNGQ